MTEKELAVKNLNKMIDRRLVMLRNCYDVTIQHKHMAVLAELKATLAAEMAAN